MTFVALLFDRARPNMKTRIKPARSNAAPPGRQNNLKGDSVSVSDVPVTEWLPLNPASLLGVAAAKRIVKQSHGMGR